VSASFERVEEILIGGALCLHLCAVIAFLFQGHTFNYQFFFFRINQVIPRAYKRQVVYPIPCFLQPVNGC